MHRTALSLAVLLLLAVPPARGTTPTEGRATDVVLLIDRSQSLTRVDPDDLLTLRTARLIVESIVATSTLSGTSFRLAVAEFGDEVRQVRPLTPVRGPLEIAGSESRFERTNFLPALQFAQQSFAASGPLNRRLIFLLTDGLPALGAEALSREELAASGVGGSIAALEADGAEIFLVAIRTPPHNAGEWRPLLPEDHYLPLNTEADLVRIGAQLLNELTGRRLSLQLADPGVMVLPLSFPVSDAARPVLLFALKGSSQSRLSLFDPQGQPRSPTLGSSTDPYAFYLIQAGIPGPWRLEVRGDAAWVGVEGAAKERPDPPTSAAPLSTGLLLAGSGLLLAWPLSLVLCYRLRRRQDQTQSLEAVDVESVSREVDQLVEQHKEKEAETKISSALSAVFAGVSAAIPKGTQLLRKILDVYSSQPDEQRRALREQLHSQPTREAVQAVAQTLWHRWQKQPDLFLAEFYFFRDSPRGSALVAELSRLPSEGSHFGHFLREVATQTDRIQLWMDEES